MLKLVTLAALLAVVVAKPQYPVPVPVFTPYPFPYYYPYVPQMKSTDGAATTQYPAIPAPYFYPFPIPGVFPYPVPMKDSVQESVPKPAPSPVEPAPVETPEEPLQETTPSIRIYAESPVKYNPSLQLADLLLNAEQKRELEEAVVGMNPLEYAARLEVLKDPKAAMRLFDRY